MKKRIKKIYIQQKKRYMKSIVGTNTKPRLSVFRSHNHIYAQVIDDLNGYTLVSSSSVAKSLRSQLVKTATKEAAFKVGEELATLASKKNINAVVFDRNDRPYHGRIKSLADGARSAGLLF